MRNPLPPGLDRSIPALPWFRIFVVVAAITTILLLAWELEMRNLGLRAGDLDDGRSYWTVERRKIDAGPRDPIIIIGDSRILFDTDLATWQTLTGRRPIQLALVGGNAQPILHNLAVDENFSGLLVIGIAEFSFFRDGGGSAQEVLDYFKTESPSQRIGHQIYRLVSRHVAFLDSNYTLFTLLERHDWPERKDVDGPYLDVWKVSESYDDRQTYLWDELERDAYLREHARRVWMELFSGPPVITDLIDRVIAKTRSDIDRIRARGGEVVWVRPPSGGPILEKERVRFPRGQVWDRLLHDTRTSGVYFEDYPQMQQLSLPDWSHLSRASAVIFTNAYVRALQDRVDWFKAHGCASVANKPVWNESTAPDSSNSKLGYVPASTTRNSYP
jgi:hypothetical protein